MTNEDAPTDADAITELDETTVERIAAGEVVERPASVVKELVENSLDAGATRVEVTVERGGTDLIRVRDDGAGMTESGVRKAVEQHTTSKIRSIEDLESGVPTLGFRGEALHTIGAVSRLTIRTKHAAAEVGTELRMAGGDVVAVEPAGCPAGTTVEVTDLFYNTPAREKYLKTDRTEFARVNDVVTNYGLANPNVAVSLTHDGREVFATPGQGDLQEAILAVYGRDVAENMVAVDGAVDGPLAGISGYVSHPETTRSSRDYVSTFVDGRYVRSPVVREAVVDAYGDQLAPDRYPFAVLLLAAGPGDVDVNVHPRKMEVRWADEAGVRDQVEAAVRTALLDGGLLRSSAPRGRSAPDETAIAPETDGPADGDRGADGEATAPGDDGAGPRSAPSEPLRRESGSSQTSASTGDDDGVADQPEVDGDGNGAATGSPSMPSYPDDADEGSPASNDTDTKAGTGADADADPGTAPGRKFGGTDQRTLDGDAVAVERAFDSLPPLRVLGQYDDTYIVAAAPDGLVVVDQHAADERINYERLRERFRGETTTQALAQPVELELTAGEAAAFDPAGEALGRLGFRAERTGDRTVAVRSVPAVLADALEPALLRDVLAEAIAADGDADAPVEARADDLLADLACYPSVTGNTPLATGSVLDLLEALDDCENPYACPHGRPTIVHIDDDELDERFERDYPGHGGRRGR